MGSRVSRPGKGCSLISFPENYTVLDFETTGLDPFYDEIIEVSAIRIREFKIVDTFTSLVNPGEEIDEFITALTGITNEMVADSPRIDAILPSILEFIGGDIVVGHNVNFDINFLYEASRRFLGHPFSNDFVDTMRLSRRLLPDLPHHRLQDLVGLFGVDGGAAHRALSDCYSTQFCYLKLYETACANYGSIDSFFASISQRTYSQRTHSKSVDLRLLSAQHPDEIDEDNPFYEKNCVFTGVLTSMSRESAAQLVVNCGGHCANGVTRTTDYLILGNGEYRIALKDGKSNKRKKAELLKSSGYDIEILSEDVFLDLLNQ